VYRDLKNYANVNLLFLTAVYLIAVISRYKSVFAERNASANRGLLEEQKIIL